VLILNKEPIKSIRIKSFINNFRVVKAFNCYFRVFSIRSKKMNGSICKSYRYWWQIRILFHINLALKVNLKPSDQCGKQLELIASCIDTPHKKSFILFWNLKYFKGMLICQIIKRIRQTHIHHFLYFFCSCIKWKYNKIFTSCI
jgi:hypothetical protein